MGNDLDSLTLKDIKVMVIILEEFVRTSKRIESLLARYNRHQSHGIGRFTVDDVVASVMARQQAQAYNEIDDEDMNDEDIKRVLAKIKGVDSNTGTA